MFHRKLCSKGCERTTIVAPSRGQDTGSHNDNTQKPAYEKCHCGNVIILIILHTISQILIHVLVMPICP